MTIIKTLFRLIVDRQFYLFNVNISKSVNQKLSIKIIIFNDKLYEN